jgi:hypothetical protein
MLSPFLSPLTFSLDIPGSDFAVLLVSPPVFFFLPESASPSVFFCQLVEHIIFILSHSFSKGVHGDGIVLLL